VVAGVLTSGDFACIDQKAFLGDKNRSSLEHVLLIWRLRRDCAI